MTKPPPCIFRQDHSVPPDHLGRPFCLCGAVKTNPRHALPDVPAQAEVAARYEHEED